MLRRRLAPEPFAAAASLCRGSAAFGATLAVIAVLMSRSGSVDPRGSLAVLGFGLGCAVLALVLVPWSAVVIWRTGYRGTARSLTGFVIALAVLAYPTYLAIVAARVSSASDVSTDPVAPPPFSTAAGAVTARGGHVPDDLSAEARDSARRTYPNLQPVLLDVPEDEAYGLALKAVEAHGWRVIEAVPPKGKFGTGHIDAVAPTRVMALPDDVAIRIRPVAGQTRVDIRSASRFSGFDAGENAARIQSLSDELLDAAS